jgi:predicted regulator of Ras-like GTPase activity (Roadblock/LC7/MglB family)
MDAEQQCFPIITALLHEAGGFFTMSVAQHQASKSMELQRIISAMHRAIPELHGVMIASVDGLAVAHDFPDAEAERVAAMSATALGLGKRITERTNLGGLAEAVIRGDNGYLVVYAAGKDAVLVLLGPIDSNLGLMRLEARVAAVDIKQILGQA